MKERKKTWKPRKRARRLAMEFLINLKDLLFTTKAFGVAHGFLNVKYPNAKIFIECSSSQTRAELKYLQLKL